METTETGCMFYSAYYQEPTIKRTSIYYTGPAKRTRPSPRGSMIRTRQATEAAGKYNPLTTVVGKQGQLQEQGSCQIYFSLIQYRNLFWQIFTPPPEFRSYSFDHALPMRGLRERTISLCKTDGTKKEKAVALPLFLISLCFASHFISSLAKLLEHRL